jgi:hypothetical protein
MKIELNPSRMTVEELNDAIAELTAQRERIREGARMSAEIDCYDAIIEMFGSVWEHTESGPFDVKLKIKTVNGREYRIPLNQDKVEYWELEVSYKATEQ